MVEAIDPDHQSRVIEIGPGPGVLTAELVGRVADFAVIEIDKDLVSRLKKRFADQQLSIFEGDVLSFDFSTLLAVDRPC